MTALELVERARAGGLTLEAGKDGRLLVRPRERLTPELRALLVARKAEVLALLSAPTPPGPSSSPDPAELARVLSLPLDRLDAVLRVTVLWLEVPLWFVPDGAAAEALVAAGEARRGEVWTRQELLSLLSVPGLTTTDARTVALAKLAFDGDVAEVRTATRAEPERGA